MTGPTVVFGAGGHAKVIVALMHALGEQVGGCIDDDATRWGSRVLGVDVRGPSTIVAPGTRAVLGIGKNATRQRLANLPMRWATLVHPRAFVDLSAMVGEGSVVFAGAVVQPEARIGTHAIVNTGCRIDHDCVVGAFAHIAPGVTLAGDVTVGEGAFIGAGATVIPGRTIGAWATVGAGAVVLRDVEAHATVVGVPARLLRGKV